MPVADGGRWPGGRQSNSLQIYSLTMFSTNWSWSYDFAYDVTATSAAIGFCVFCDINTDTDAATSFRIELTPNFNTPSFIYAWVCVRTVSRFYSCVLRRYCEEENGGQDMPPSGWRVARRPSGRRVDKTCVFFGRHQKM